MKTEAIQIVDIGRGPQLSDSRITVMDVFYYLNRGRDFDYIQRAMPSLTRDQFDAVALYVNDHRQELIEADQRVDEFHRRGIAEQKAKGLSHEIDRSVPVEVRAARLNEKLRRRLKEQAEKNGGHTAD